MTAALMILATRAEAAEKVFEVSKIGTSKEKRALFMTLWESLQVKDPALAAEKKARVQIKQALGKEGTMHLYIATWRGDRVAVLLQNGELLEGAVVSVCLKATGIWDGATVLGAAKRFQKFTEVVKEPDPDAPTKEAFMERLKSGGTYQTAIVAKDGCEACFGDGKKGSLAGNQPCADCDGTGEAVQVWTLKW